MWGWNDGYHPLLLALVRGGGGGEGEGMVTDLFVVPLDKVPEPLLDVRLEVAVQWVGVATVHLDLGKYVELHSVTGNKRLYLLGRPWFL